MLLMVLAWLAAAAGCGRQPPEAVRTLDQSPPAISRDGYSVRIYPTAEEQLRYARAFSDPPEKRAALEVLIQQHPESRLIRGQAELDLAYMTLGPDYRLADPAACRQAMERYERIAAEFADLPSISAKAYWYMGWIMTDLLREKRIGIEKYRVVVDRYADEIMRLEPPAPWVSLVMPQIREEPPAAFEQPAYHWAGSALLEIIRASEDAEERRQAFRILWSRDRGSPATGYALLELLRNTPSAAAEAAGHARTYLETGSPARPLADDIRKALQALGPDS